MAIAALVETQPSETGMPGVARWTPRPRRGPALVARPRLVQQLQDPEGAPFVLLVAPAGYGKTTLLEEWSRSDPRPFAWLTLDERDNDPGRLLHAIQRASQAGLGERGPSEPFVLVLDDAHAVHDSRALTALGSALADLPPHAKVAIASRTQPSLHTARMRAHHELIELGPRELAMTRPELAALLKACRHEVGRDGADVLLARTEGWPAAVVLASLFLADRGAAAAQRFCGLDRLVTEYVHDEVLEELPAAQRAFMLRTSVASTLTAPLCDALAGHAGSAATLAALGSRGLLVPLDRTGVRYRHHRLLAEALRAELRREAPELEPELHRRASTWYRSTGDIDRAITHALSSGAVADAAELVWSNLPRAVAEGRTSTVERWLDRFSADEIAERPRLASAAAGCAMLRGRGDLASHWLLAGGGRPPETVDGALRSLVDGVTRRLAGEPDAAGAILEAGARAAAIAAPAIHALCLAELAALAAEEDDWERAAVLVTRARAQVDRHRLADHAALALVFAVSALVLAHRGMPDAAQGELRRAITLCALFADYPPLADAEVRLTVARAALRLGEVTAARAHLADARRLLRRVPEAHGLHATAAEVATQLDAFTTSEGAAVSSMTAAELRILQFLPTHLSFREIGDLACVSANTVKTQANAVYRKLGVSSRSEAVVRARGFGLLDP